MITSDEKTGSRLAPRQNTASAASCTAAPAHTLKKYHSPAPPYTLQDPSPPHLARGRTDPAPTFTLPVGSPGAAPGTHLLPKASHSLVHPVQAFLLPLPGRLHFLPEPFPAPPSQQQQQQPGGAAAEQRGQGARRRPHAGHGPGGTALPPRRLPGLPPATGEAGNGEAEPRGGAAGSRALDGAREGVNRFEAPHGLGGGGLAKREKGWRVGRERDKELRRRPSLPAGGWALSDKARWGLSFSRCGFELGICGCLSAALGFFRLSGNKLGWAHRRSDAWLLRVPRSQAAGRGKKEKKEKKPPGQPASSRAQHGCVAVLCFAAACKVENTRRQVLAGALCSLFRETPLKLLFL